MHSICAHGYACDVSEAAVTSCQSQEHAPNDPLRRPQDIRKPLDSEVRAGLSSAIQTQALIKCQPEGEACVTVGAAEQQHQQLQHRHLHKILMCASQLGQDFACVLTQALHVALVTSVTHAVFAVKIQTLTSLKHGCIGLNQMSPTNDSLVPHLRCQQVTPFCNRAKIKMNWYVGVATD